MPRRSPDHRAQSVLSSPVCESTDPRESALFHLVKTAGDTSLIAHIEDAYLIYVSPEYRHIVDALLLGKASNAVLRDALDLPEVVTDVYRHLFFDVSVFRHALDVYAYARSVNCTDDQRQYYLSATQQGPTFLADKFRVGDRKPVDPKEVMRAVLGDLYVRFLDNRGLDIETTKAQAALRLAPELLRAAALVNEKSASHGDNAAHAIKLALHLVDETKTPEQASVNINEIAGLKD
jgi:hypothetical protein